MQSVKILTMETAAFVDDPLALNSLKKNYSSPFSSVLCHK